MKANEVPERLYLSKLIYGTFLYQSPDPDDKTEVEYTHTDAFIEKAEKWLEENVMKYLITTIHAGMDVPDIKDDFFDDFKKHLKRQ